MGPEGIIDLQSVLSLLRDDPRIYNVASYLICVPLLLAGVFVTLRCRPSAKRSWLALAAIAPLTLLPFYHRQIDAKLLLLTVPACAMLWAEGGRIGKFAALVTAAGFVVTGDLPWITAFGVIHSLHLHMFGVSGRFEKILPVPVTLLAMSVFYLWVYARSGQAGNDGEGACEAAGGCCLDHLVHGSGLIVDRHDCREAGGYLVVGFH
jgi:hypothetical protein